MRLGSRFSKDEENIKWAEEWQREEDKNCVSKERNTMEELRAIANSVMGFLNFTAEFSKGRDKPAPCVNTQLWHGLLQQQATGFEAPGLQWRNRLDKRKINYIYTPSLSQIPSPSSRGQQCLRIPR